MSGYGRSGSDGYREDIDCEAARAGSTRDLFNQNINLRAHGVNYGGKYRPTLVITLLYTFRYL